MRKKIKYSEELADRIFEHIVECRSLDWIGSQKGMPSKRTILRWVARDAGGFRKLYAAAKELQADAFAEEILAIADNAGEDTLLDEESGRVVANHAAVQRARLRIDSRKWLMSKMLPRKYGNHTQLEHSGSVGPAVIQVVKLPEQAASTEEWEQMVHSPQGTVESGSQN